MTYTPSYRKPAYNQHTLVFKAYIALLVINVIKLDDQDCWKALVERVGGEEAKRLTMVAY